MDGATIFLFINSILLISILGVAIWGVIRLGAIAKKLGKLPGVLKDYKDINKLSSHVELHQRTLKQNTRLISALLGVMRDSIEKGLTPEEALKIIKGLTISSPTKPKERKEVADVPEYPEVE
jgi:hypothetical protein